MSISNFPGGFANGVTIKGVPIAVPNPGAVFWVNNSGVLAEGGIAGSDGNKGTYRCPFATLEYAIGRCTTNRGDVIYLMPGHSEACASAGAIDFDVAGITVVGLGTGSKQAQIRWTLNTATIHIDEDNITFINVRFTAAYADVAVGFNVDNGDLRFIGCRFDEEEAAENWVIVANIADGLDNIEMVDCTYHGADASNDTVLAFAGTHENTVVKGCRFVHSVAQTAAAPFITSATQQVGITLQDNFFHTETAAVSGGIVVLTGTTNTGFAIRNMLGSLDADAAAADVLAAFDVTGLMSSGNMFSGAADGHGIETFTTVDDLT